MRRLFLLTALLFALPAHAVTIDWVTVGDPGNACDPWAGDCYGAVNYAYRIGKYEVTNAQYAEFLNAVASTDTYGLYSTNMASPVCEGGRNAFCGGITRSGSPGSYTYSAIAGRENMPVNWVSFWDALRFANWLHNGQGSGDTETGAYTITALGIINNSITRNAGATIFLTSEDEWYKAAYYDAGTPGYNPYPFADGFNGAVCEVPAGTTSHSANCGGFVYDLTDVGDYTDSPSEYGTFDQGGNVWEWNEAIIGSDRSIRGGSFDFYSDFFRAAYGGGIADPSHEYYLVGFRVASLATDCEDEVDNDGDGFIDHHEDPGCADADDLSENDPALACDDGADNDGDLATDYPGDIGCKNPSWATENPECSDGIDNADNDDPPLADWDGAGLGDPDPQCSAPWDKSEAPSSRRCGLGTELAFLVPPMIWLHRRRSRRR